MSNSLTVRLTASRSSARRAPISYTPPVTPPPPSTSAVRERRRRRRVVLLAEPEAFFPAGFSSLTTVPIRFRVSQGIRRPKANRAVRRYPRRFALFEPPSARFPRGNLPAHRGSPCPGERPGHPRAGCGAEAHPFARDRAAPGRIRAPMWWMPPAGAPCSPRGRTRPGSSPPTRSCSPPPRPWPATAPTRRSPPRCSATARWQRTGPGPATSTSAAAATRPSAAARSRCATTPPARASRRSRHSSSWPG